MSFCSLCRVPATDKHKSGGWHQHNKTLQTQGKMPMSKDLFDQFEAQRYKKKKKKGKKTKTTTTSTSTSTSSKKESKVNKKNVNAWHWEERNVMPWATTRLPELLTASDISFGGNGTLSVTKVDDIKGDAYINMRKGKFRLGFEIAIGKVHWEGEIKSDDGSIVGSCKGSCAVSEFCEDAEDDDYDVCNFKMEDEEKSEDEAGEKLLAAMKKRDKKEARDKLFKTMKKEGRNAIIKQLQTFTKEMHKKKDDMKV